MRNNCNKFLCRIKLHQLINGKDFLKRERYKAWNYYYILIGCNKTHDTLNLHLLMTFLKLY